MEIQNHTSVIYSWNKSRGKEVVGFLGGLLLSAGGLEVQSTNREVELLVSFILDRCSEREIIVRRVGRDESARIEYCVMQPQGIEKAFVEWIEANQDLLSILGLRNKKSDEEAQRVLGILEETSDELALREDFLSVARNFFENGTVVRGKYFGEKGNCVLFPLRSFKVLERAKKLGDSISLRVDEGQPSWTIELKETLAGLASSDMTHVAFLARKPGAIDCHIARIEKGA